MTLAVQRRRFTVDDYYQMGKTGILREDDRVELIEGDIYHMKPFGSPHSNCISNLITLFSPLTQQKYKLNAQNPVHLDEFSEPQPDFIVLKPRSHSYVYQHPRPEDIILIVEVSDTSTTFDQDVKIPLYAKYGIEEVWQVDLNTQTIITYRNPSANEYQQVNTYQTNDPVSPQAFPSLQLTFNQILYS